MCWVSKDSTVPAEKVAFLGTIAEENIKKGEKDLHLIRKNTEPKCKSHFSQS